jgi:hypothetical protein
MSRSFDQKIIEQARFQSGTVNLSSAQDHVSLPKFAYGRSRLLITILKRAESRAGFS